MRTSPGCHALTRIEIRTESFVAKAGVQLPVLYIRKKRPKEGPTQDQFLSSIPWYPEVQWELPPTATENDIPKYILCVTSKVPPARVDTTKRNPAM